MVGGFLDDFAGRFAGAMTGASFDPDQSRRGTSLGRLQGSGELKAMRGKDAIVVVGGSYQSRWILGALRREVRVARVPRSRQTQRSQPE